MQTNYGRTIGQNLFKWLFTPFLYVRGDMALRYGILAILIAGVIASFGGAHFDGVLDLHFGPHHYSMLVYMTEGIIDWFCASIIFLALGRFVFKSKVPAIEIFGTQAFCRIPTVLSSMAVLPHYCRDFSYALLEKMHSPGTQVNFNSLDGFIFAITLAIVVAAMLWMVVLMAQSFFISFGIKFAQGIFTFFLGLVLAEFFSKIFIMLFIRSIG